ncbi:MAG: DUF4430 domain-containing protein [bacterium]
MGKPKYRLTLLIPVLMILPLAVSCGSNEDGSTTAENESSQDSISGAIASDSVVIELVGIGSTTVFELLKQQHQVDFKSSALGVFVTAIDSVENGSGAYWIYTVNDSTPNVACDKFLTESGDVVKWHFRKME